MNLKHTITSITLFLLAVASQANDCKSIYFHGTVRAGNMNMEIAMLHVKIDGQPAERVQVSASGNFRVFVPVGSKAILSFSLKDHQNKTLVLDTENALATTNRKKNKKVEFHVVLRKASSIGDSELHLVGRINFLKGSGLMKVNYDPAPMLMERVELIALNRNTAQN